ncbi:MAG TPA: DUF4440 domain-containing protein [Cyanobacteria bacterium UBA8530]|nr:DUF4440 domain-containing protein [Cyanobacteria bacterium UBA8530]
MNQNEAGVLAAERSLLDAMLRGDVPVLDKLISEDLLFTNQDGALISKELDLSAHRSGMLRVHTLVPSEQKLQHFGDTSIVSVKLRLSGTYGEAAFSCDLRYTRVWQHRQGSWQVIAAHCSPVSA